jgi:hypothetical protein
MFVAGIDNSDRRSPSSFGILGDVGCRAGASSVVNSIGPQVTRMSAKYSIRVEKDGANVTARYELKVDMGSPALLASFELNVAGINLIDQFLPQKEFTGTKFAILDNPDADAAVTFAITTNEPWNTDGLDNLRGEKRFDDVSFAN